MKAEYSVLCSKTSLPDIRQFVTEKLSEMEVEEGIMHQLVLAVDEACTNSIVHHHQCDGTSRIRLCLHLKNDLLSIELSDIGTPFPIDQYQPKDLQDIIRQRKKGGLGILLITKIMDKVEVVKGREGFTYRFIKKLSA